MGALIAVLVAAVLIATCSLVGGPPNPPPTATPAASARILLDSPAQDQQVSSPLIISGRMAPRPPDNSVTYRIFGPAGSLLASGTIPLQGAVEQPGTFAQSVPYTLDQAGLGRVEVLAIDPRSGATLGISSVAVSLGATGAAQPSPTAAQPTAELPTPLPPPPPGPAQQIFIDTPPPGTSVGSPVVITGRTVLAPANNLLSFYVRGSGGAVIGTGQFPVSPVAGGSTIFNASISFNLPPQGDNISVEIFAPNPAGGAALASASIPLRVEPPQRIYLETPPPGTAVGSPVVITGRTDRFPFQGNLAYRITDVGGRQIGGGIFDVSGAPGGPTRFNPSLTFNVPPQGGRIRIDITDENADDGQVAASAAIELNASPPAQQIFIDTPSPFTAIGSPVTLTGRTVRYPSGGRLSYRVRDANGAQIGSGQFPASGTNSGAGTFTASIGFPLPPQGGTVTFDLFEVDAFSGQVTASASIPLTVNPPRPPDPPTPAPPANQSVTIDSPASGTLVGSPVTITGRVGIWPAEATLGYRVTDLNGNQLGQGGFQVGGGPGQVNIPWVVSVSFTPPAQGGPITVEIFDDDEATGGIRASASVRLQTQGQPVPPIRTLPGGNVGGGQEVLIDTPAQDTIVGSPLTLTGRTARAPADGNLNYRITDLNGRELASGFFQVQAGPGGAPQPWTASITFVVAPESAGPIIVEVADRNDTTNELFASASVRLQTARPQPRGDGARSPA